MIVGVPSEVKTDEYRVGMRPVGAELLIREGHTVVVHPGSGTTCTWRPARKSSRPQRPSGSAPI
jgi:alanine dehydrogenase